MRRSARFIVPPYLTSSAFVSRPRSCLALRACMVEAISASARFSVLLLIGKLDLTSWPARLSAAVAAAALASRAWDACAAWVRIGAEEGPEEPGCDGVPAARTPMEDLDWVWEEGLEANRAMAALAAAAERDGPAVVDEEG